MAASVSKFMMIPFPNLNNSFSCPLLVLPSHFRIAFFNVYFNYRFFIVVVVVVVFIDMKMKKNSEVINCIVPMKCLINKRAILDSFMLVLVCKNILFYYKNNLLDS